MPGPEYQKPTVVVRAALAVATVGFGVLGLALGAPRFLAAAGVLGIIWTAWDVMWDRVLGPAADWITRVLTEGLSEGPPADTRPTLDDTIRLLESHLARDAARSVHLQAAIRLEAIYRTVRKDPARAREVIAAIRARYPDAPELARFEETGDGAQGRRPDG
jgi:hypothetical protein